MAGDEAAASSRDNVPSLTSYPSSSPSKSVANGGGAAEIDNSTLPNVQASGGFFHAKAHRRDQPADYRRRAAAEDRGGPRRRMRGSRGGGLRRGLSPAAGVAAEEEWRVEVPTTSPSPYYSRGR